LKALTVVSTELPTANVELFQPHFLVQALRADLNRTVLRFDDDRTLSAGEFLDKVSQFAQGLASFGLEAGNKVGVLSANRAEVLFLTAACLLNRYILVPMHPMGSLDDHVYAIRDADVGHLVFDADRFSARAERIREEFGEGCTLLALGENDISKDLCAVSAAMCPAPLVAPLVDGDEIYRLSYTGGTTGRPKAVAASHRMALTLLCTQLAEWEWPTEVRQLVCAPLSHAGAAMFLPTLMRGGELVILPQFDPVAVMTAIERRRITCVLLVPTMVYALLDHPRFCEFDLSSLETVFYGASPISPVRLQEAIEKLGPIFFQFYGQAEAPMTVSVLRRDEHTIGDPLRLASCGRPVPGVQVVLIGNDGCEVMPGEPGELCVRGPLVMGGYHNRERETEDALSGGWLHTGDVAVRDPDGFLRIVDRKKDMIISGGFNVYPREIEDALAMHPAISRSAVIGVRDDRWGEAVKAIVVLRPNATATAEELIAFVRAKKGPVHSPKSVEFVVDLPLTPVGKIDKKELRIRFSGHA
jgi:fatty-acyl-CoA synthase